MKLLSIAAGSVAALILAGTAAASAHHAQTPIKVQVTFARHAVHAKVLHQHGGNGVVGGWFLGAATSYLGVDRPTLVADLEAGQSLAQIATAHGKTAAGLVTALLAPAKLKLDAAVAGGRLTAAKETTILTRLQTALTTLVNKALPAPSSPGSSNGGGHKTPPVRVGPIAIVQSALTYLGVDMKTLLGDLRNGQTLAQVATSQGKTAAGLVDAIVAPVKTRLDARVAAGKLTSAQETSDLATLTTNVTAFVNGTAFATPTH